MRCVDAINELATPTGTPTAPALATHLAGCPRCAAWAEQAARLDRLWEQTRPTAPPEPAWDAVWARVAAQLDRPARPVVAASRPFGPGRRAVALAFGLAQAAAVVAAVVLLPHPAPRPAPSPTVVAAEAEPGETLLIVSTDDRRIEVRALASNDGSGAVDPYYAMLNAVEGMASLP